MFGLFSKKSSSKGDKFDFSVLKTDMHSHILPGIDDGSDSIETSLELIRGMKALGYTKLIATPHVMWDMYRNTTQIINEKLRLVREAVKKEGIDIELGAAAEYFLDEHVEDMLKQKQPLLTISENKVLVEFSMAFPALNIKDILFEMQMQGYQPVIAHPERSIYLQQNKEFYDELRDTGCIFQLNILALGGHYGKSVSELAQYLLKNNFYSLAGTDLHHEGHLEGLNSTRLAAALSKGIDWSKFTNNEL
ncbi:MAG: CpsB/CapC family capsule biosynthesis tyrosine phosphatase [Chitinophagaceae bacterium]